MFPTHSQSPCTETYLSLRVHSVAGTDRDSPLTLSAKGACGPVARALDSRSEGLGFDSQGW